ncbi:MAG: phosphatidylinositol-specific phospholipase C/glycerophosphodiester phosphodiesterase family protein [Verrucomicrobiales bacterium]
MARIDATLGLALAIAGLAIATPTVAPHSPSPLPRAHAHNDYEHPRPLLDALDQGFGSVEADIWLVDGVLLVAHDREGVKPEATLEALYIDPLHQRVRQNAGAVHPGARGFTLLIDLKSEAEATYAVLRRTLERFDGLFTRFTSTSTTPGPVTVILSGNRPTATVAAESSRWCAIDGRLPDLTAHPLPSVHLMPLVSQSWSPTFHYFVDGVLPEPDRAKLRETVALAHRQGRRLRFWGIPDQPFAWKELHDAGVDLINTDNLAGLREFLVKASVDPEPRPKPPG